MHATLTATELRNMTVADLHREIADHMAALGKTKIAVRLNKEKDTAKVKKTRQLLARAKTILAEKLMNAEVASPKKEVKETLKKSPKTSTVRAPKKS